jgi:hypothetical protein
MTIHPIFDQCSNRTGTLSSSCSCMPCVAGPQFSYASAPRKGDPPNIHSSAIYLMVIHPCPSSYASAPRTVHPPLCQFIPHPSRIHPPMPQVSYTSAPRKVHPPLHTHSSTVIQHSSICGICIVGDGQESTSILVSLA